MHGLSEPFEIVYKRNGKETFRFKGEYEGVIPNLDRRFKDTESEYIREKLGELMLEKPCPSCAGSRYKPEVLAVRVAGLNVAEVGRFSVLEAKRFFHAMSESNAVPVGAELLKRHKIKLETVAEAQEVNELNGFGSQIAAPIIREVLSRLSFLENVGLEYLSLDRSANSLSGGEAQRIRLATQVGSGLTGVLYVLDEPSIGLHPKDNERLLVTLKNLRDLGNTLIVVEHDEDTIRHADWVVDLGPGAGIHGGHIVSEGTPTHIANDPDSLDRRVLAAREIRTHPLESPQRKRQILARQGCERAQPQKRQRYHSAWHNDRDNWTERFGQKYPGSRHSARRSRQRTQPRQNHARTL